MTPKEQALALQVSHGAAATEIRAQLTAMEAAMGQVVALVPDDPAPPPPPPPPPPPSGDFSALNGLLATAPKNTWIEIPNTRIPLTSASQAQALRIHGYTGPSSVIYAWNSAANTGRSLLMMGGGHADYGGNEVYELRYAGSQIEWERLTVPSAYTQTPGVYDYPIEGPDSSHTYDGLAWVPQLGEMFYWPGVLWTNPYATDPPDSNWGRPRGVWAFNLAARTWRLVTPTFFKDGFPATALLPDGRVFFHATGSSAIFDPATGTYGPAMHEMDFAEGNAEYAPNVARIYITNGGNTKYIDAANTTVVHLPNPPRFEHMNPSLAWHPTAERFLCWAGKSDVLWLQPSDNTWGALAMTGGPTTGATQGVFGRGVYIPEADCFLGYNDPNGNVWIFRPDFNQGSALAAGPSLAKQLEGLADGETRAIAPGIYREAAIIRANDVTLDMTGVHLRGVAAEDKAALVLKGANPTIVGLECSGVKVWQNGAAVRFEGPGTMTLRGVHFHGNEMNVTTNNDMRQRVVIESGRFGPTDSNADLGHSIYIGRIAHFELHDSKVLGASNLGHLVKSRASVNDIAGNIIDQADTSCSCAIDLPDGGDNHIKGNTIIQGPKTDNAQIINVATEIHDKWTIEHAREGYIPVERVGTVIHPEHVGSTTLVEDNDIASEWVPQSGDSLNGPHMSDIALISNGGTGEVRIRNNRIKLPKPPAGWTRSYWKPVIWEANEET